jgi:HAD superfamily hydrolase (TIGR01509 family)
MLVIFDCDGVLVDSESIGSSVVAEFASELGWPLDVKEATRRFKGFAMPDIWADLAERVAQPLPPDIESRFRRIQLARLQAELIPIAGLHEMLSELEATICVASNGPHEKMRVTLGAVGLWKMFEGRTFSRTDVARPKPHPDLYLHAAKSCGFAVEQCVVVEDSPLGVQAARAAGMRVFGFDGTDAEAGPALLQAGAELVFSEMRSLPVLVRVSKV